MSRFLLIWLLLLSYISKAQENTDSLRQSWQDTTLSDSLRLKTINQLAWDGYIFTKPDSANYYGQLHYDFAEERGLQKEMAKALNTQGTSFYMMGNYAKATAYFYQSLKIKEDIKDTLGIAATLNNLGMIDDDQGLMEEANKNYTKALELTKSMLKNSDDPEFEKHLVASYNNLGTLHTDDNPELALVYFIKMINITSKLNLRRDQAYAYNNMANIYSERGEKEKALEYYQEGLAMLEKLGDHGGIVDGINNIGIHYFEQGSFEKSMVYARKALKKARKHEIKRGISDAYEILYECYKASGNNQEALRSYELHIQVRDSIEIALNKQEVIRQGFKYKYEKQAAADSIAFAASEEIKNIQIAEQEAQLKSEQLQRFLLYGVLIMIITLSVVLYRGNKRKIEAAQIIAQQKEEVESQRDKIIHQHALLEEKNREVTDFNENLEILVAERTRELEGSLNQIRNYQYDLAHNIRAPFVSLLGLLNLIKDERLDSDDNERVLQELQNTGDKIALVLQDISKELGKSDAKGKVKQQN